jgi:hypothetical protein
LDLISSIFELIDMRSFSNLWFWIALAVLWSSVSHWVLGVPYDMIVRAHRQGGAAEEDVQDLARIYVKRLTYIYRTAGVWVIGCTSFALCVMLVLGFFYAVEFAQALFLLACPMSLVAALSMRTAWVIDGAKLSGERLHKILMRQRIYTQFIGMVSIFVTALWGMSQNLTIGPF